MELEEGLFEEIKTLCIKGDAHFEEDELELAAESYEKALELLPAPKEKWEAALWIYTALGDAYFNLDELEKAEQYLGLALACPEGDKNPYIQLVMGKTLYELGKGEEARDHLLEAYELDGEEVFEDEDPKYLDCIEDLI